MVFGRLLPREGNFFELFNEHAKHISTGARAFQLMVQNYADPQLRERHAQEVDQAERAADRITAEAHRQLHRTFICFRTAITKKNPRWKGCVRNGPRKFRLL